MNKSDILFSRKELKEYLLSKQFKLDTVNRILDSTIEHQFKLVLPRYYADLIDWNNPKDPLLLMSLPMKAELASKEYELIDPIGDRSHSPVQGIVHRYPDRCLLMLTAACAVHCRFCFRKSLLESNSADFHDALKYIENHAEIWEVIFSGGDPFILSGTFIQHVLSQLAENHHLKVVRFHTRTPAVYPAEVSNEFVRQLTQTRLKIIVVLHVNHPREVTAEFCQVVDRLTKNGCMVLSQTVLLKGVNDNTETLSSLFKQLVAAGVKPYYLHHLDFAAGTDHFRVSVEKGKQLMHALRGSISGHCLPEYVIDLPGGHGKVPVFWFTNTGHGRYTATSFQGETVVYQDPINE